MEETVCILLVEDEYLIRLILVEELSEAGFEVCEAENGDRAAALILDPPVRFTLLITDIHMPGRMNGIEVARLMRGVDPSVPVIYMTGRPDALGAVDPSAKRQALLQKPFSPADLLSLARALLAQGREH